MNEWRALYKDKVRNAFPRKRILVTGDLMVDEYVTGKVLRISPEAPVPVLDCKEKSMEAGGASNVAHNIKSLGAEVAVAGCVGEDRAGEWLRAHFENLGILTTGIVAEAGRMTTVKTRYATKEQQLLRIDQEDIRDITDASRQKIYDYLLKQIEKLDAVVLSDYKKGVLNDAAFVQRIIRLCKKYDVLVAVDSKSRNIAAFENADFVKPNNLELEEAAGIRIANDAALDIAGRKYLEKSGAKALIVTRGKRGISVFRGQNFREDYAAKDVAVYDVCGAGDTVLSTVSLAMVSGLPISDAVKLANLAAGIVITKWGTAVITPEELIRSIDEE